MDEDAKLVTLKDTVANPAPLGLMAFGMTTVLLNLAQRRVLHDERDDTGHGRLLRRRRSGHRLASGVQEEQHLRGDGVRLFRALLAHASSP